MQILCQVICIGRCRGVFGMLLFLYTLLLFHHLQTMVENTLCRIMGETKYPLLSRDGEVTIGGIFAVHSKLTLSSFEFTQKPQPLSCSRFVTVEILRSIREDYV